MKFTKQTELLLAGLCLSAVLVGCNRETKGATESPSAENKVQPNDIVIPVSEQAGVIATEAIQPSDVPEILRVPGKIVLPDNGTWRVGAIAAGRVERVLVSQGDHVRQGQLLASMHSRDVHEAKAEYLTAMSEQSRLEAAEALAKKNFERTQRLYALKAASLEQTELARQQWLDAQAAARNSAFTVQRSRSHLEGTLGIPATSEEMTKKAELLPIRAPASGYVLEKHATPGTVVEPSTDLFVIGELKRLWMIASVREEYLGKLRVGQLAKIAVSGNPELHVEGRLTNVGQQFNATTHVMQVRIEFENPDQRLRPEMLADAEIPIGGAKPMLLVPSDAVQQIDSQDVVFVRTGPDHFAMQPVRTAQFLGNRIPILEGLKAGEQVVTRGAFVVKSEMLKSAMEGD